MLKEINPSESVIANQIAQRLVNEILMTAKRVDNIRTEGIPAIPAMEATEQQVLPDGRVIPARPARPAITAVSAKAINSALGKENCEILDSIKSALI